MIGWVAVLGWWSRRSRGERDGSRTVCRFSGGSRLMTEHERSRHWHEGAPALGEGVLLAIAAELAKQGASSKPPRAELEGWTMRVKLSGDSARIHVRSTANEPDVWELVVSRPWRGGAVPAGILAPIDRALRSIAALEGVAWYSREDAARRTSFRTPFDS